MRALKVRTSPFANQDDHDCHMRHQHDKKYQRSPAARFVGLQCAIPLEDTRHQRDRLDRGWFRGSSRIVLPNPREWVDTDKRHPTMQAELQLRIPERAKRRVASLLS